MFQVVARALPGTLLFRSHAEARALWTLLVARFPEALSLCLMPNHLHVDLPHDDPAGGLSDVMGAYARFRNHSRSQVGRVWEQRPETRTPEDADHARRLQRYTLLNPTRAGLVADPLAWPWSSHRDLVGLADSPLLERAPHAGRHHAWVSGDPSVHPAGTPLPRVLWHDVEWGMVIDAVCAVTRSFPHELQRRGHARTLALKTAWAHDLRDAGALAAAVGVERRGVHAAVDGVPPRGAKFADPALAACVTVVGDARFSALFLGDLRGVGGWARSKYRHLR